MLVNSKALELCGIDKDTPDPNYAIIERNGDGEPTGYILEQAAMVLFTERALNFHKQFEKEQKRKIHIN